MVYHLISFVVASPLLVTLDRLADFYDTLLHAMGLPLEIILRVSVADKVKENNLLKDGLVRKTIGHRLGRATV